MSARDWARAIASVQSLANHPYSTLPQIVLAAAAHRGDVPALIGLDTQLSHGALAGLACRYARWALAEDVPAGAVVALLMPNCPDYVAIWLGLTQIGCTVALLNTELAAEALAHSLRVAGATRVIVAGSLLDVAGSVIGGTAGAISWWSHGESLTLALPRVDHAAAAFSADPLAAAEQRPPAPRDRALLIYTSGTTGLPKAAAISHARMLEWSGWFAGLTQARATDRLYDCLPLYHSTGGVVAIGSMLLAGGAVVIRERFSASRFWPDVIGADCTIVQYIGELCRYLLQAPAGPAGAHAIRLFCGNGLREDVWQRFAARFAIPRILEFYAATEGAVSLYNVEGRPGAIGRVPGYLAHRFPVALIRFDVQTSMPLRDAHGRCLRCTVGEVGEAIGPVDPSHPFDGYTDAAATARKLLHDVFAPGDCWFRTGDLMRQDDSGYFYFVDRLGDTYRWKGQNVSTTEVEMVITRCPGVIAVAVYGVAIPGTEGRAGMAALVVDDDFTMIALADLLTRQLPGYARPVFIRLCPHIDTTGTFKQRKTRLMEQAYDDTGGDPVWQADGVGYRLRQEQSV